jgi:predicted nuclease of predicted toxin-antitoxin system
MKLLLDTCVWGGATTELNAAGHDAIWAGSWPNDPGDDEILKEAYREGRILVTADKDFGELAIVRKLPHPGIVRLVGFSGRKQGAACLRALDLYGQELQNGAIVTVEPDRVRIRPSSPED